LEIDNSTFTGNLGLKSSSIIYASYEV